jgi:predicted amidohydrolase YtcJ
VEGAKLMLDGVIDAYTGAMLQPYADRPETSGALFWDRNQYINTVSALDREHFQVSTHAIGDAAIRLALDGYEAAQRANGIHEARHKVEHIEDIAVADIPRFGKLGVVASFQPLHADPDPSWMGSWIPRVGPEREQRAWAWRSILRTHGRLAFGSDWPVVTINPWRGIQMAVTRQDAKGQPPGGWIPDQKLTLKQAVRAYTLGGAWAMHRDHEEGSIAPGKLADLVMLSQNIFAIDPHTIAKTKVLLTIVGGKIVYDGR